MILKDSFEQKSKEESPEVSKRLHCKMWNRGGRELQLLEYGSILHFESQPQLEPIVFGDEVSLARTEGFAQAIEELCEAADLFVSCVPVEEQWMSERPLCLTSGEADLTIAASRLAWARGCQLRLDGIEGAIC